MTGKVALVTGASRRIGRAIALRLLFDEVFRTNVRRPFFLTQRALSRMRENGRIINISSGLVRNAVPSHFTALQRVGQPRYIADIIAFLASDRGGWVTANWIDATGGQSL